MFIKPPKKVWLVSIMHEKELSAVSYYISDYLSVLQNVLIIC